MSICRRTDSPCEPVAQTGLDRFAFATILRMNDYFRAGHARVSAGLVGRAVIDHENMVQLGPRPQDNFADVFFLVVSGNDRGNHCSTEP